MRVGEVDVAPTQGEQLALTGAGAEGQDDEGIEARLLALAAGGEEAAAFLGGEKAQTAARELGRQDQGRLVVGDPLPLPASDREAVAEAAQVEQLGGGKKNYCNLLILLVEAGGFEPP